MVLAINECKIFFLKLIPSFQLSMYLFVHLCINNIFMPTNSFWSNILQLLFGLGVNKTNDVADEKVDKSSIQLRFPFL